MAIKVGDKVPAGALGHKTADGISPVSTDDLFGGKKVVLFSVPGAFTPTCSAKHLPGFVQQAGAIKAKGNRMDGSGSSFRTRTTRPSGATTRTTSVSWR